MISQLFTALKAGYELSNATAWKRGGVAVASLTALLSALSGIAVSQGWLPSDIPPETIMQISSGIVALVGVFLGYVQTATTTRMGIGEAPKPRLMSIEEAVNDETIRELLKPLGSESSQEKKQRIEEETRASRQYGLGMRKDEEAGSMLDEFFNLDERACARSAELRESDIIEQQSRETAEAALLDALSQKEVLRRLRQ